MYCPRSKTMMSIRSSRLICAVPPAVQWWSTWVWSCLEPGLEQGSKYLFWLWGLFWAKLIKKIAPELLFFAQGLFYELWGLIIAQAPVLESHFWGLGQWGCGLACTGKKIICTEPILHAFALVNPSISNTARSTPGFQCKTTSNQNYH